MKITDLDPSFDTSRFFRFLEQNCKSANEILAPPETHEAFMVQFMS